MEHHVGLMLGAVGVIVASVLWKVLVFLTWRPYRISKSFREQGVKGPEYKFWSGSIEEIRRMKKVANEIVMDTKSHDVTPRILPQYLKWISQYGGTFLYWFGPQPRLCITDPELIKQVLSNKFGFYIKTKPGPTILALLGRGLVLTEGSEWARHRRIVSPAFTMDKLKMMTKRIAECVQSMLDTWKIQVEDEHNEIEVNRQFQELTADVISHTAFGSSYGEGKEVFLAQKELQMLAIPALLKVEIPGSKYLPTKKNLYKWRLEGRVRSTLMGVIQSRMVSKDSGFGNDLLGLMMEACFENQEGVGMSMDEIIDECKTFFFAGHETTSHLLTWTVFLLSINQDWQEKLREEVMRECGMEIPSADNLSKLKLVTMVLFETLRLYCPANVMLRRAAKDMNLGGIKIPQDTTLTIPIPVIHHSKEVWGDDANEFNPLRFENGIAKAAKHPNALVAFSLGPRSCVGQNFAMLEAKTVIAMILQRFSFSLSPEYKHLPANMFTIQPQCGLPIVLKPLVV